MAPSDANQRAIAPRILLITDPDHPEGVVEPIRKALAQGADSRLAVQLRAKSTSDRELISMAHALRKLTTRAQCRLFINARADIAALSNADGVHLPEQSIPAARVRSLVSTQALIGRSCHDELGIKRALEERVDYITLGPVAVVPGKAPPLTRDQFRTLVGTGKLPVLALGGATIENFPSLLQAGAHGIAVIRGVLHAAEPAAALQALFQLIDKHS